MRRSKGYTAEEVARILEQLQDVPEDCSEAEDDPVVVYDGGVDAEEDNEESLTEDSSEDTGKFRIFILLAIFDNCYKSIS